MPSEARERLMRHCRLHAGQVWQDDVRGHSVGCMDAASTADVSALMAGRAAALAVQDPPYNQIAFAQRGLEQFVAWCRQWIESTQAALAANSSLYVWLGADQNNAFQPLPDFMIMMRETPFRSRSLITMRNQRGYGTLRNWMAVRQELLYYTCGEPAFDVDAEYTDIPKILRGYYKHIDGELTENLERSRSQNIRAGNVWVDIQQVFYRMEENVNGCYAQKPLKSIERIIRASSSHADVVLDSFSHSGTTLLACERLGRQCCTMDVDPLFCEITIRRLEHFRRTGLTGWQNGNPFEAETQDDPVLQELLGLPASLSEPLLAPVEGGQ